MILQTAATSWWSWGWAEARTSYEAWVNHTWFSQLTLSVVRINITPNILMSRLERLFPRASEEKPIHQKTTHTIVGKYGHQHVSLRTAREPLGTPAKGDKWGTVLGNIWAWDQFGRQGGGVKLHILLIKKREQWVIGTYRCSGLWKREGRRL